MYGDDGFQAGRRITAEDHSLVIVEGGIAECGHINPCKLGFGCGRG